MNKNGMKCIIYVRVSTEMQVDGYSLDGQKNILTKYAEREGMTVLHIYEDAGKSGKSIEGRPAFKNMLLDIENGLDADYILVYKLSRFGRNAADILNSLEFIKDYDVNLISVEEGLDSAQTTGKLLISIMSTMAEMERENIIEQTMNGRREKARQGGWNGGFAPYGYTLVDGKLIVDAEEAETVKLIFTMYAEGTIGIDKIARELNNRGIKKNCHYNASLDIWSRSLIKNILSNPIYIGKMPYGRRKKEKVKGTKNTYRRVEVKDYILSDGEQEAIISQELWDKVNQVRDDRRPQDSLVGRKRVHYLSSLLRCPRCGGALYAMKYYNVNKAGVYKEHWFYECRNHKDHKNCDYSMRLFKPQIEPYVIELIKRMINNKEFISYVNKYVSNKLNNNGLETTKKEYELRLKQVIENKTEIEKKLDNMPLDEKHRDRKIADLNQRLDDLYDLIDELETSINSINVKLASAGLGKVTEDKIMASLQIFDKLFENMDEEEKNMAIRGIVSRVELHEEPHGYNYIKNIHFKFNLDKHDHIDYVMDGSIIDDVEDLSINYKENTNITLEAGTHTAEPKTHGTPKYRYVKKKTVTYKMIIEYVKEKYGFAINSNKIAEVKRKHGLELQSKKEVEVKYPCPPEKVEAIEDALRYYKVL